MKGKKWSKRRIITAAVIAGVLAVAAVLAVVFFVRKGDGAEERQPQSLPRAKTFNFVIDTRIDVNPDAEGAFGSDNNEVILQVGEGSKPNKYTINWGDGCFENSTTRHVYADAGEYTITIMGTVLGGIRFSSEVGEGLYGETRLTQVLGMLPKHESTDLSNAFYGCANLTAVPEYLFDNNTAALSFEGVFSGCESLESIPEMLFARNKEAVNFCGAFAECAALKSIPGGLFARNPAATGFAQTFSGCGISEIPENLFAYNGAAVSFSGAFINCSALQSIPADLFAGNPDAEDFSFAFSGCVAVKSIPANLFAGNAAAADFSGTFMFCSAITGPLPGLWLSHPGAAHILTFSGCEAASNYNDAKDAGWAEFN